MVDEYSYLVFIVLENSGKNHFNGSTDSKLTVKQVDTKNNVMIKLPNRSQFLRQVVSLRI